MRIRAEGDRLVVNAPKGAMSPEISARIREHKAELLSYLAELGGDRPREPPIAPMGDAADGALSFAQIRLWLTDQIDPESGEHNLPGAWRLVGPCDQAALVGAFDDFVRRHALLRSHVEVVDGKPRLVTREQAPEHLEIADLRGLGDEARAAELHRMLDEAGARPFDLAGAPPFRCLLLRVAEEESVICVVSHALIWDGWSFDIFLEEMGLFYEARVAGTPPKVVPLPIEFRDFAAWQRQRQDTPRAREHLAWWQQQLAGHPPLLALPFDRPRRGLVTSHGARQTFIAPAELARDLYALARAEEVTPYMVLLAAYAALLGRIAHSDDVIVTTPVRGRDRLELEHLIGSFTNTIFLRVNLAGNPTFRELIARARDVVLEGFAHQETPVDVLLEGMTRDLTDTSFFQVNFSYQNTQQRSTHWGPLAVLQTHGRFHAAHADLNFWVRDGGSSLSGAIDYRTDFLDQATANRIIEYILNLLAAGVRAPDSRLDALALMSPEESRKLRQWQTGPALPDAPPGILEALAAVAPERTAILAREGALRYGELGGAAARAVAALRAAGVARGDRVAAVHRDARRAIASLLASLAAGAVWVPLDPADSPERHAAQLAALGARAAFVDGGAAPASLAAIAVALDGPAAPLVAEGVDPSADVMMLLDPAAPDGGAAVTYTGAALAAAVASRRAQLGLGAGDRVLVALGASDPAAMPAFLAPLCAGAELAVASPQGDEHRLAALVATARPGILESDAGVLGALAAVGAADDGARRRAIVPAGDLNPTVASVLLGRGFELSTRAGGLASFGMGCVQQIRAAADVGALGAPVAGASVRLVDARGRAVPIGVEGELAVGGAFAARGDASTGVRGRWLPDGGLELREQARSASIAGRPVDLDVVERALAAVPGVRAAHVAVRGGSDAPGVIVGWVLPRPGEALTQTGVRGALRARLGDAWIPRVIMVVDEIPAAGGGAVIERELRDPFSAAAAARFEPPADGLEKTLAGIWSEVLGIDSVGAQDNFFELGGTSLMALRVIAETEKRAGWQFSPRLLFFQNLRQIAGRAPGSGSGAAR